MTVKIKLYKFIRRKILGQKGTIIASNIVSTLFTGLGFVNSLKENKKEGISAVVLSYNESEWIELSLKSISDLVDEYIVVDSSDDETVNILDKLKEKLPLKIIRQPPLGPRIARETALKNINYKYVLIWDSDFIANNKLKEKIRNFLENHDRRYYYLVYWPWISFCGDLSHRCRYKYHIEHWMFTYSKKLKYLWDGKIDYLITPIYYKRVIISQEPLGYHMNHVKKPERIALNILYREVKYFDIKNKRGVEEADKALKEYALKRFGTTNLRDIGLTIMRNEIVNKPRFDYKKLPDEILNRAIELGIQLDLENSKI